MRSYCLGTTGTGERSARCTGSAKVLFTVKSLQQIFYEGSVILGGASQDSRGTALQQPSPTIMAINPILVLLFSGKRKSGKDHITELLQQRFDGGRSKIIRLSGPIKEQFALDNDLDYSQLLTASDYKEKYRSEMIVWSEAKRALDKGYFIRAAIEMYEGDKYPVWIVSDMRRRSDLMWFREHHPEAVYTVRITATEEARKRRGWVFMPGVDDAESECDLDSVTAWDLEVDNSQDEDERHLSSVCDCLVALCSKRLAAAKCNADGKTRG